MAGSTSRVGLMGRKAARLGDDRQFEIFRRPRPLFRRLAANAHMFLGRAVARFAVDARLAPRGIIAIGFRVVVGRKLADVAVEARRVEGKLPLVPVECLVLPVAKVPHGAGRGVVPFFSGNVVGQRQNLQPPAVAGREKVIDVFATQHMHDGVLPPALGPPVGSALDHPTLATRGVDVHPIAAFADGDFVLLRLQLFLGQSRRVRLHGQPVMRSGPKPIKTLVAIAAAGRADVLVG